jgi:hypothetical protein
MEAPSLHCVYLALWIIHRSSITNLCAHIYLHLISTTPLRSSSILIITSNDTKVVTITIIMITDWKAATLREQHGRHTTAQDRSLSYSVSVNTGSRSLGQPTVSPAHWTLPSQVCLLCRWDPWRSLMSLIDSVPVEILQATPTQNPTKHNKTKNPSWESDLGGFLPSRCKCNC